MTPIDSIDMISLGINIRRRRESLGMTQEQLGEYVGLTKASISKYEDGKIKQMTIDMLAAFTRALKVHVDDLIGKESETESDKVLEMIKSDTNIRMVAKIGGELSEEGVKELLKYANYIKQNNHKGVEE